MKVLLNEEDRVLATFEDGMEDEAIGYDDERWKIIQTPEAELSGDYIDNYWDGTQFIYNPKHYEEN